MEKPSGRRADSGHLKMTFQFFSESVNSSMARKMVEPEGKKDESTVVGTVITGDFAKLLGHCVYDAVAMGGKFLLGGGRKGALLDPTILNHVPREADVVHEESYGTLAPIVTVKDGDDSIAY
jgi:acyl-CoA reductase-like NAD-dependent aldehyde dehydrogenase